MTIVWVCSVDKAIGMGWYIVKNWIKDDAVYEHGPFNTMIEAQAYAKKHKINE